MMMGFGMMWLFMALPFLLVVAGLILLGMWFVRQIDRRNSDVSNGARAGAGVNEAGAETPLAILQRRYAGGDISAEEYARIRADLLEDRNRG